MGAALLPDAAFGIFPCCSIVPRHPLICRIASTRSIRKRNYFFADKRISKSALIVFSQSNDSDDTFTDVVVDQDDYSGRNEVIGIEDDLFIAKKALSDAQHRQKVIEKERDQLLEELARSEAKKQEYITTILRDKEVAVGELEAAKSLFQKKLEESVEEKFSLESKLVLAKQDAVDLAVQVEKLAEVAFQQATSHILEDAQLRISSAETTAAEAAHLIEKQIKDATEGTISSIVEKSNYAIERALVVAEEAGELAKKSMETFIDGTSPFTEIAAVQAENIKLKGIISDIESQLMIARNDADKLKLELENTRQQLQAFEQRANDAEKALLDFQESSRKNTLKQEEEMKLMLEKVKKDVAERTKAISKAFKADLKNIKATVEAAKEVVHCKDYAYLKRCEALQRSLKASEDALKMWRQRTEMAESLLLKERLQDEGDEDSVYVVNGGRIDLLTDVDSQKWKLLSDGPRREIPQWMARRIKAVSPKFPPKKIDVAEALTSKFRSLELPTADEVWSIAREKPKEGDALIEHVYERETIEKKRKALERALQRKTIQWQRAPEQTKLEPGTGTGREIVFQGFNWESWRRRWYLELAAKTADLSHCGVTAVWLPPPTESVSPQGYMPSDLYNLNSSYGTVEELKYCIEEMHSQDLLALGDVVLNHRCAQKQSPNGVWNIYGGKLAWGPEAIVCDDPNFEGRGNPSSGDIFHAAPNIDHSQDFVRKDIKMWLNWLRNDIGFDGWRLDFVRGFSGTYVKEYIEASNPVFAIGEYWDSLSYEHGSLCYNQDAHRQRIINWINATGGTSSAFDITTKGILHSALHNEYWRLIDPQGKPTGVMGWWASRAVTFLENHDTGSTQGHWPFPRDKLMQGYAYILTHPGTPAIFYDHFYDFGIHDVITELIEARKRAGIHCRSSIKIYHANNEGYVAQVGDALVMKLGQFDWNPSKENQLEGSWQKFVDKGSDYQVWLRQ
ncbi:Alpha-amylase 3, chloroplastic [Mucuna pruriens]|uniref:alpha-amylase n=1 Tax=Mucuna pruriens TaxID=157652 RepID=A0A371GS41_MUCPR|nr:Alpha-amylase 3, chloroplastic [Mucuna pruriens]